MDWLAKFLHLPEQFLHSTEGPGGGVIQGSASEAILVAVLAAREQNVRVFKDRNSEMSESEIRGKLVGYSSDQSNSCVEKAGLLGAVPIKLLSTDNDGLALTGEILEKAIAQDLENGLIPIVCIATIGTTATCAYDDIASLALICKKYNIWLHIDAAYAGFAFGLDEYKHLRHGLEDADSLNFNLHKMFMVNFDCCAMWLRDANLVCDNFNVDRIYLQHRYEGLTQIPDFRHWQIPLGRRFRALKVWITFRSTGAEGLRAHVKKRLALAKRFENYVREDDRFEIVAKPTLGLVCFRPRGDNQRTTDLLQKIVDRKKIFIIQAEHKGVNFLRFAVCGMDPKEHDIHFAWQEIETQYAKVLSDKQQTEAAKCLKPKPDMNGISECLKNKLQLTNGEKLK